MAGKLAELYVIIGANADKFIKAMDSVQAKGQAITTRLRTIEKAAAVMGTALVGAMAAIVYKTAHAEHEMVHLSEKVGIGVETLSSMSLAAKKSGFHIEEMAMGLGILARRMVEGNKIFKEMGIEVRETNGKFKSLDSMLFELADIFAKTEDQTKKIGISMELFGRSGKMMIPMLNEGSEALRKEMEEAKRLGIVIDEKTGKAAIEFMANLENLKASITGTSRVLAHELIPIASKFFEVITEQIVKFKENHDLVNWAKSTALAVINSFGGVIKILYGLGFAFGALKVIVYSFGAFFLDTAATILKAAEWLGKLGAKIMKVEWVSPYADAIKDLEEKSGKLQKTIDEQIEALADQVEKYEKVKEAIKNFRIEIEKADKPTKKIAKSMGEILPVARELGKVLDFVASEYESNIYKIEALNADYLDIIARNVKTEFNYRKWALKKWYEEEKQKLLDVYGATDEFYKKLCELGGAYQAELGKIQKEEKLAGLEALYAVGDATANLFTQIGALANTFTQNRIAKIDEEYQKKKEAIDNSLMDDQQKYAATERLDREYERKKRAIQKEAFETQKKISLATAAINIAEAITKAYTSAIPPWNFILAGFVAAAGAIQLAAIAAQKFPGAKEGGITEREGLIYIHPHEAIIPLEKLPTVIQQNPQLLPARRQKQETNLYADIRIGDEHIKTFIVKTIENELRHKNLRGVPG